MSQIIDKCLREIRNAVDGTIERQDVDLLRQKQTIDELRELYKAACDEVRRLQQEVRYLRSREND